MRKLKVGDMFGYEEIVQLRRERVIQARITGKNPAEVVYIHRDKFLQFTSSSDVETLIQECQRHTRYVEFGRA